MKREFVQLAHKFDPKKISVGGWWQSEKLDFFRVFWDGGVTRGMPKSKVPWANTAKDKRYTVPPVSTGLWTRYGNVYHAPDWWLDCLPPFMLDGEFGNTTGQRGVSERQRISSIIKNITPVQNERISPWQDVRINGFDIPPVEVIFADGWIENTHYRKHFYGIVEWFLANSNLSYYRPAAGVYRNAYLQLEKGLKDCRVAVRHEQKQLPFGTAAAESAIREELFRIAGLGGEGTMIRHPDKPYVCERSHFILKDKAIEDMEGTVFGYTTGRETDKGSKLLGMMGAIILRLPNGKYMELSGFEEIERRLVSSLPNHDAFSWACSNPGVTCPDWINNPMFPRGAAITFKYRGVSSDGIPQEARYDRVREAE